MTICRFSAETVNSLDYRPPPILHVFRDIQATQLLNAARAPLKRAVTDCHYRRRRGGGDGWGDPRVYPTLARPRPSP